MDLARRWWAAILLPLVSAAASVSPLDVIQPVKGLIVTSTVLNGGFVAAGSGGMRAYSGMDMEEWQSVADSSAEEITYQIRLSTPGDARANADMQRAIFRRRVRRQDIAQSLRINWGVSTADPEIFAGQTYEETSLNALQMLKAGQDVAFVIGAIDGDDPSGMGALLHLAAQAASGNGSASPLAGMGAALQVNLAHTYYRGAFHRVESAPVSLSVLLNGARVSLPTIHAQGSVTSANGRSIQMQFWWLDSPHWPLALKKTFTLGQRVMTEQVTRIDLPPEPQASGSGVGASAGMAEQLRKSCHIELSGIYFNTGSAQLLPESQPALQAIARVIGQSGEPVLVIAGHTDNIGTMQFNQALSEQRAAAVREALVAQFGVAASRLMTQGYGFTRPLESNATVEGRARNRRVELLCRGHAGS
jgi:outer membrane protein OmpA-like peptidoglycan-associated protein